MSPFLRIGLSNFDCGSCQPCQGEAVNPYCAVLVKEYVESGKLRWVFQAGAGEEDPSVNCEARPFRVFKVIWCNLIFIPGNWCPGKPSISSRVNGLSDHLWTRPRSPAYALFHWPICPHKQREQRKGEMGLRALCEDIMGAGGQRESSALMWNSGPALLRLTVFNAYRLSLHNLRISFWRWLSVSLHIVDEYYKEYMNWPLGTKFQKTYFCIKTLDQ